MKVAALEVVRALAALLVLVNHLAMHVDGFPQIALIQMPLNYATEAVIVFFVLSGVVITLRAPRKTSASRTLGKITTS